MSAPLFDAEREARLRFLLVEFALGNESAKTFDVDEMRCLHDDVRAMIGEIDRLRAASSSSTPLSETASDTRPMPRLECDVCGTWCRMDTGPKLGEQCVSCYGEITVSSPSSGREPGVGE